MIIVEIQKNIWVRNFLHQIDPEIYDKYYATFIDNGYDKLKYVISLTMDDLSSKEMNIKRAHRKLILDAVEALKCKSKQQQIVKVNVPQCPIHIKNKSIEIDFKHKELQKVERLLIVELCNEIIKAQSEGIDDGMIPVCDVLF